MVLLLVAGRAFEYALVAERLVRIIVHLKRLLTGSAHHPALLLGNATPLEELVSILGAGDHAARIVHDEVATDCAIAGRRPGAAAQAVRIAAFARELTGTVVVAFRADWKNAEGMVSSSGWYLV